MSMSQLPDYIVEEIYPQLPDHIVEAIFPQISNDLMMEILSRLSVPHLCRCLRVCKDWHSLIRNPDLGVFPMTSEKAKPIVGFLFARNIRMIRNISFTPEPNQRNYRTEFYQDFGWSFMDLTRDERSKVWLTVRRCEMDIGGPGDALTNRWFTSGALTMDAGLVCEFLKSDRLKVAKVFVYNPIGKTQHVLPFQYLMCKSSSHIQLQMVVDNIAHTYKIYLMNNTDDDGTDVAIPILRAYDSSRASSGWRTCSRPPIMRPTCSVMFEGMLYVMFYGPAPFEVWGFIPPDYRLLRYNPVADVWENIHLRIRAVLRSTQLIVSDNRLFLVTWITKWNNVDWRFHICEITFPPGEAPHEFKMSVVRLERELAWWLFDGERPSTTLNPPKVIAFGSFKSIILMSRYSDGILIVYDLVKRSFEPLFSELTTARFDSSERWISSNMNVMNLVLPSNYPDGSGMLHNMNHC